MSMMILKHFKPIQMKNFILIILIAAINQMAFGQNQEMRQKIESARIALITERLDLTPEQAEKFWPLYNEFRKKNQALKKTYDEAKSELNPETATEEEKKAILNLGLKLKEEKVQLEKEYAQLMLNVISAEQLMALRKAEEDFRRMILQQIQKRRMQRQNRRQMMRDRNLRDDG